MQYPGDKIRRALGPMAHKIACGPSKLTLGGPEGPAQFEAIVIMLYVLTTKKESLGP